MTKAVITNLSQSLQNREVIPTSTRQRGRRCKDVSIPSKQGSHSYTVDALIERADYQSQSLQNREVIPTRNEAYYAQAPFMSQSLQNREVIPTLPRLFLILKSLS